jgi:hypothetical protein
LYAIGTNLATLNDTMHDWVAERKLGREQRTAAAHNDRVNVAAAPLPPPPTSSTHQAVTRLQSLETHLTPKDMVNMIDLLSGDVNCADTYLQIEGETYRKVWISKRLTELRNKDKQGIADKCGDGRQ